MRQIITSIKDERVQNARLLQTVVGRQKQRKVLAVGDEAVLWALMSNSEIECVFAYDKIESHNLLEQLDQKQITTYFVSEGILKKISNTSYLVSFVAAVKLNEEKPIDQEIVVVLDNVKDHGNIGTIVRTSAAFGINQFVSTNQDLDLFFRRTVYASRGSVFNAQLKSYESGKDAIEQLKKDGYQVIVTTLDKSISQPFVELEKKPTAIVFGNETQGCSKEVLDLADIKVQISMTGGMESLNVGVAAGISLYELKTKVILTMLMQKIKSSLGRNLQCAAQWNRLVFDKKLRESTPINADQAILLMILKCDEEAKKEDLIRDAGIQRQKTNEIINPLIAEGYLKETDEIVTITEKGEKLLAQIWIIGELVDNLVLEGFSDEEKKMLDVFLIRIQKNCEKIVPYSLFYN